MKEQAIIIKNNALSLLLIVKNRGTKVILPILE